MKAKRCTAGHLDSKSIESETRDPSEGDHCMERQRNTMIYHNVEWTIKALKLRVSITPPEAGGQLPGGYT